MFEGGGGIDLLKRGIYERQTELHNLASILSRRAGVLSLVGISGRVAVIVLGAFVASQGVANELMGEGSSGVLITYTVCGVLIAAISGLEAAFRSESRSAELKLLAAACQSTIWQTDSEWQRNIGLGTSEDPVAAAQSLLATQDRMLAEIYTKAAQLGLNITQDVRELWGGETRAAA